MLNGSSKKFGFIIFFVVTFFPIWNTAFSNTMVLVPSGSFLMGGESETDQIPAHEVFLDSFYIDKTEVTQQKYKEVMGRANFSFKGENHPAEQISWYKAASYCEKIGKRLPSQEEWEKAAKGQTNTKYFWGKKPNAAYAWYGGDYDLGHHPVGQKKPNSFGLFDTSGNVWELSLIHI